jgi:DNA-binding beta-propeller fold protein YncE
VTTVSVGNFPFDGIAINPLTNTIYTTNWLSDSVSVINGRTNTVKPRRGSPAGPQE